jgi:hypothetical protein
MAAPTIVICGTHGAWIADLQKRYARELGSGEIELVIPERGDKHYGLLQDTLARLKREGRELTRLLIRRGFGLSAYLFQKVSVQTGGRATVLVQDISEVLAAHFKRNPGAPVDSGRLVNLTGPRLLALHEPLFLDHPAKVLSQFSIVAGEDLSIECIEISSFLSKADLVRNVQSFQPTALLVSSYRERSWRPRDLLLGATSILPPNCRVWQGKTLFHALHLLMTDALL